MKTRRAAPLRKSAKPQNAQTPEKMTVKHAEDPQDEG
jgi:hypothetical protein